jgi:AcrR family transcriptional regulator
LSETEHTGGGHRERLLEGALICLRERGYARTTTRDIVAASGTNLGSIVYHYGTKERLLEEAMGEGFRRWTEAISAVADQSTANPFEQMRAALGQARSAFDEQHGLFTAFLEAAAETGRSDELRGHMAEGYEHARRRVGQSIRHTMPDAGEDDVRTLASLMVAIVDGLMLQWLLDRDAVPRGEEVAEVFLRAVTTAMAALDRPG